MYGDSKFKWKNVSVMNYEAQDIYWILRRVLHTYDSEEFNLKNIFLDILQFSHNIILKRTSNFLKLIFIIILKIRTNPMYI